MKRERERAVLISLDVVRHKNVMQLKKLNTALFPVRYNEKYNADALASGDFTKLAYYSDICVGAIACRLEKKEGGALRIYIMTLGVLAPYRGLGIGTRLLNHVLDLCTSKIYPRFTCTCRQTRRRKLSSIGNSDLKSQAPSRTIILTLRHPTVMPLRDSSLLRRRNDVQTWPSLNFDAT